MRALLGLIALLAPVVTIAAGLVTIVRKVRRREVAVAGQSSRLDSTLRVTFKLAIALVALVAIILFGITMVTVTLDLT